MTTEWQTFSPRTCIRQRHWYRAFWHWGISSFFSPVNQILNQTVLNWRWNHWSTKYRYWLTNSNEHCLFTKLCPFIRWLLCCYQDIHNSIYFSKRVMSVVLVCQIWRWSVDKQKSCGSLDWITHSFHCVPEAVKASSATHWRQCSSHRVQGACVAVFDCV